MDEQEARDQREATERSRAKEATATFRKDVQEVMALPGARRLLHAFLHAAAIDVSPLRHDSLTTGHAIAWHDAAGWWLNQLRAHCPEREGQMRAEAKRDARNGYREPDDE